MHQVHLADAQTTRLHEWNQALGRLHDFGLSAQQSVGALANQVVNQAYTRAALDLFWLFGVLSMVMIPLIWITRRSMSGGAAVAAD
jgi:DHA2 family multidrug resistance protein